MDRWQIAHRIIAFEDTADDNDSKATYTIPLWRGENLPSHEEEVKAHIGSIALVKNGPPFMLAFPQYAHEGIVLQRQGLKRIAPGTFKVIWVDVEDEPEDF